jgi:hypothetical protein
MFKCAKCKVQQPAGTKPILTVIEEREVTYNVIKKDEEGEEFPTTTSGREVVKEVNLCRGCAGLPLLKKDVLSPFAVRGFLITRNVMPNDHRRRCKESPDDCHLCKNFVAQASNLPLHFLSMALSEAAPQKFVSRGVKL